MTDDPKEKPKTNGQDDDDDRKAPAVHATLRSAKSGSVELRDSARTGTTIDPERTENVLRRRGGAARTRVSESILVTPGGSRMLASIVSS